MSPPYDKERPNESIFDLSLPIIFLRGQQIVKEQHWRPHYHEISIFKRAVKSRRSRALKLLTDSLNLKLPQRSWRRGIADAIAAQGYEWILYPSVMDSLDIADSRESLDSKCPLM